MVSNLPPHLEALAQKKFKYIDLFDRYAAELRKDLVTGKEAYDKVAREWDVVLKPGEKSDPNQDPNVSQKMMEDICAIQPKSLEDYVKVMCAAFGMSNSIVLNDMRKLKECERGQVNVRVTELVRQTLVLSDPTSISLPFQLPPKKASKSEPLAFPGQTFSRHLFNDTITYQICGIALDADKALRYKIKYGDNVYEEELGQEEMCDMLEGSLLLDT